MNSRARLASSVSTQPRGSRVLRLAVNAGSESRDTTSRTQTLRELLLSPGIKKGPCCHDALSARLIERAGFPYAFMSGFCTSSARLGAPDVGLISYGEMVDQGRYVHEATRHIPIIGDGDTGYGNAMNVKRTVRGYAQAGFAGILIEDQIAPKSCGHVRGKRTTSREEAVSRIRAAADARDEGADILIVARTDARQAVSLEEALWRVEAFADAGADILFIDALESVEEMKAFCNAGSAARSIPKMANMLEGGGKTPILMPEQLEDIGFKIVAYPLSLLGVSIRAMEVALEGLKDGRVPGSTMMGSFGDIQASVGFPEYYAEEARYAISVPGWSPPDAAPKASPVSLPSPLLPAADAAAPTPSPATEASGEEKSTPSSSNTTYSYSGTNATYYQPGSSPVVEADAVVGGTGDGESRRSRFFLVKITDGTSGYVKLETRVPAGFLSGLTALVPAVAGFDLEAVISRAMQNEGRDPKDPIANFTSGVDKIEVFLE